MKEITLAAKVENLDEVLGFIDEKLEAIEWPHKEMLQLDIALEEMFVNVASYAYEGREGGECTIIAETFEAGSETHDKRGIRITLVDNGIPYNPLAKEDPDITLDAMERQIGGLGIYMVKQSMDEVYYEHRDGCNRFTMVKYF